MKLLLDTHTFIWWDLEPGQLSPRGLSLCQNASNQMVLSVASVWEMQIKIQLGKLQFPKPLRQMIAEQQEANQMEILPVALEHVLALAGLPMLHKDPFDRLIIAQAKTEAITLLSRDPRMAAYPVAVD
ncbi:MAG: type II toxin-antitoxin system VapC family toxin, partial [Chloroflexi bacterium]